MFTEDSNGNKWYDIESECFGITAEGRVLDEDGIPYDTTSPDRSEELKVLIK